MPKFHVLRDCVIGGQWRRTDSYHDFTEDVGDGPNCRMIDETGAYVREPVDDNGQPLNKNENSTKAKAERAEAMAAVASKVEVLKDGTIESSFPMPEYEDQKLERKMAKAAKIPAGQMID